MRTSTKIAIGLVGGTVTAVIFNKIRKKSMMNSILEKIDSGEGSAGDSEDMLTDNAFDPNFWKTQAKAKVYTTAYMDTLIEQLVETKSIWNDDEKGVYAIFEKMPSKAHISRFASQFSTKEGERLYDYLTGYLNDSEMNKVFDIVKNKPNLVK